MWVRAPLATPAAQREACSSDGGAPDFTSPILVRPARAAGEGSSLIRRSRVRVPPGFSSQDPARPAAGRAGSSKDGAAMEARSSMGQSIELPRPTSSPAQAGRRPRLNGIRGLRVRVPPGFPLRRSHAPGRGGVRGSTDGAATWACSSAGRALPFRGTLVRPRPGRCGRVIEFSSRGRGFESRQVHLSDEVQSPECLVPSAW